MAENKVSIQISNEVMTQALNGIKSAEDVLKPYLISLTADQRRNQPKMSDKTSPFVAKVVDYVQSNPEFSPAYLDVQEMKIDLKAVEDLLQIYRPLEQLCANLNDTILQAGSEAYIASLAYYNSVKQGARMNVPNAKTIFNDLRARFEKATAAPKEE